MPVIFQHDGMVIAYTSEQGISVFTSAGIHLLSIAEENIWHFWDSLCFYLDTDKIIIRLADGSVLIIFADGQCKQLQLPSDFADQQFSRGFSYKAGILTIYDWNKDYAYDGESGLMEEIELEEKKPYTWYEEQKGYQLLSPDGNVLLPYGVYDDYIIGEPFILAFKGSWGDYHQIDVLNTAGEVLLQDVFGVNFNEPSFPGTMVVWLDETHCVLLDKNGNTTTIPPYTQVERIIMHY